MEFGDRIKALREESKLSREELANKINITYSALSKYEVNKRFPDRDTLIKLANYFDVSIDYMLCRTNIKNSEDLPKEVKRVANLFAGVGEAKFEVLEKLLKELLEK